MYPVLSIGRKFHNLLLIRYNTIDVRELRAKISEGVREARQKSQPSNLRRRAVQKKETQRSASSPPNGTLTRVQSSTSKSRYLYNIVVRFLLQILHPTDHPRPQTGHHLRDFSKSIRGSHMGTIIFSVVICISGAFLVLSCSGSSNAGFWNNLSQTCFYLLTTYFSLWSSAGAKASGFSSCNSRMLCNMLLYCGVVCVLVSTTVYFVSSNLSLISMFISNFCQVVAIKLLLESRVHEERSRAKVINRHDA